MKIAESFFTDNQKSDAWVHIDVSDGKFTPHISWINPEELTPICAAYEAAQIEVHLMVEDPESQIDAWLRAGVKRIIVHLEAMRDPVYILERCKKSNAECFLAINPATDAERLLPHLDDFNGVLILGVFPGPSGQEMRTEVIEKIKYLRENNPELNIEIDGGVNLRTAKLAKEAGASLFVVGNFIFGSKNPSKAYADLKQVLD